MLQVVEFDLIFPVGILRVIDDVLVEFMVRDSLGNIDWVRTVLKVGDYVV